MDREPRTGPHAERETVARRIADRLGELGLDAGALARAAGMSPQYLAVLTEAGPELDPNGYLRIAAALGLTYRELTEGRDDRPPGGPGPGPRPALLRLAEAECWDLLGTRGVGRIALPGGPAPVVLPVNYAVEDRTVLYRTDPTGAAAAPEGTAVSFQVDRIDDHLSQGWSVLVTGAVERLTDPVTLERLAHDPAVAPWAGGRRPLWIRVRPEQVSGRRITAVAPASGS